MLYEHIKKIKKKEVKDTRANTQVNAMTGTKVQSSTLHETSPTASPQTCYTCTIGLVQVVVRLLWLT